MSSPNLPEDSSGRQDFADSRPLSGQRTTPPSRVDIFCRVVDNFGDAGVCWRLARALVTRHGLRARLWIDDLHCLRSLCDVLSVDAFDQAHQGVEIGHWQGDCLDYGLPALVIEAFGCRLPEAYLAAMADQTPPPTWINLEYLSAEDWIEECHGLPSPHAKLPVCRHFYFPGFTMRTGGLQGEPDLDACRRRFLDDAGERAAFRETRLGVHLGANEILISLFCYDNPAVPDLVQVWQNSETPVRVLLASGSRPTVLSALGIADRVGASRTRGSLTASVIPFLNQDEYDRLLWASDVNFVRGEDSWVRAIWAGKPFVWQAYAQDANVHHRKVEAFLDRFATPAPPPVRDCCRTIFREWNGISSGGITDPWRNFLAVAPAVATRTEAWADELRGHGYLAERLVAFWRSKLQFRVGENSI